MNFYETVAGKGFFESQLPKLISALQEIAQGLHHAPSVIPLPLDAPDILHDLFYGQYEPYFEVPNTAVYQKANRAFSAYLEKLRMELSTESFEKVERLFVLGEERVSIEREQAFCAGCRCAVQLLLCGLRAPGHMVKSANKKSIGK